jgi:hypothetical protein
MSCLLQESMWCSFVSMFKEVHIIICGFPETGASEMGKARQPILGAMGLKKPVNVT